MTGWEVTETFMHFSRPSFIIVPKIVNESHRVCEVMDRLLPRDVGASDLFITEPLSSDCVSHAARRLDVPLVYVVPAPLLPWIETVAFGLYSNPTVAPHLFAAYAVPDTFYRRLHSVAMHLYTVVANYWYTATAAAVDRRPYDLAPPILPALVFVNTNHVTEPPKPSRHILLVP
jgi:glucuronosyltransferase